MRLGHREPTETLTPTYFAIAYPRLFPVSKGRCLGRLFPQPFFKAHSYDARLRADVLAKDAPRVDSNEFCRSKCRNAKGQFTRPDIRVLFKGPLVTVRSVCQIDTRSYHETTSDGSGSRALRLLWRFKTQVRSKGSICLLCRIKNQNSCSKSHAPGIAKARAHSSQLSLPQLPTAISHIQPQPPSASHCHLPQSAPS
jgi:hypothetical protein